MIESGYGSPEGASLGILWPTISSLTIAFTDALSSCSILVPTHPRLLHWWQPVHRHWLTPITTLRHHGAGAGRCSGL